MCGETYACLPVAESDFIMISSDEEDGEEGRSVRGSQSQGREDGRKKPQGTKKKKTGKINVEKVFKGKRCVLHWLPFTGATV